MPPKELSLAERMAARLADRPAFRPIVCISREPVTEITQADLKQLEGAYLRLHRAGREVSKLSERIRHRILEGSNVEPGPLKWDPELELVEI
jgi:hypothetical protein